MIKEKISATVDPQRLARAKALLSSDNNSAVLNAALDALVERERERQWLEAHTDDGLPGEVAPDLSDLARHG